jgi:hypothetical protein
MLSRCCLRLIAVDRAAPQNCRITGTVLDDAGEPVQGHFYFSNVAN